MQILRTKPDGKSVDYESSRFVFQKQVFNLNSRREETWLQTLFQPLASITSTSDRHSYPPTCLTGPVLQVLATFENCVWV